MDTRTVRDQFDNALRAQIIYRLKEGQRLPVPVATLSALACLVLLVERNPKTANPAPLSSQAPLDRSGLLSELTHLGLPDNGQSETEIQKLLECQAIGIEPDGRLYPLAPAFEQVALLERLFPTAPSFSLLAYAIQSMEEVRSGRKDLQAALNHFIQTLTPGEKRSSPQAPTSEGRSTAPAEASSRKLAHLRRLSRLRSQKRGPSMTPTVWGRGHHGKAADIREVFPKGTASNQETAAISSQKSLAPANDPAPDALDPIDPLARIDAPAGKRAVDQAAADGMAPVTQAPAEVSPEVAPCSEPLVEPVASQALENASGSPPPASPLLSSAPLHGVDAEPASGSNTSTAQNPARPPDALEDESAVAEQVEAFQADLALACPVCSHGKIVIETTQKGRSYYACANSRCHFISWGKPYHFRCPDCNNPFLIEVNIARGRHGLACARATCSYRQRGTDRPPRYEVHARASHSASVATDAAAARFVGKRLVRKRVLVRRR